MIKILLVEDLDIVRDDLKNLIDWEASGYEIVGEARNGEIGLAMFRELHPDIIIADIKMPVLTGLEMIRIIQNETKEGEVGFILLTAYKEFEYARKAIDLRINSYIIKYEITKDQLLKELEKQALLLMNIRKNKKLNKIFLIKEALVTHTFDKTQLKEIFPEKSDLKIFLIKNITSLKEEKKDLFIRSVEDSLEYIRQVLPEKDCFFVMLQNGEFAIFYKSPLAIGETKSQKEKKIMIDTFLNIFKKYEFPILIVENDKYINYQNLEMTFILMEKIAKKSVFAEKSMVVNTLENRYEKDEYSLSQEIGIQNELEIIRDALANEKLNEVSEEIRHLLEVTVKDIASDVLLERTTRELSYLIGNYINKNKETMRMIPDTIVLNPQMNIYEISSAFFEITQTIVSNRENKYSRKVRNVIAYMEEHYNEDVNLSVIADRLQLSMIYICQIFKKEVGITFKEYLTKIRMREAVRLLKSGRYKVYEVSEMVGYQTVQYFSKVFKKETGKYPSDFS